MIRTNLEILNYISHYFANDPPYFELSRFDSKQVIVKQGRSISKVFFIKCGIAKCYYSNDNGTDFIQEFFGEGEIIGEIEAIRDSQAFGTIEAVTPMDVYSIHSLHFKGLLNDDRIFNRAIMRALANKIEYKAGMHTTSHTT